MKKGSLILLFLLACFCACAQNLPRFGAFICNMTWTEESADVFALDCRLAGFQFVSTPDRCDSPVLKNALEKRGIPFLAEASWRSNEQKEIPVSALVNHWAFESKLFDDWQDIISVLCEVVSKNGCLVYDVSIDEDGHFDGESKEMLFKVGTWIFPNAKAIFESKPTQKYEYKLSRDTNNDIYAKAFFTESIDRKTLYAFFIPIDFHDFIDTFFWLGNVPKGKMIFLGNGDFVSYRIGRVRDAKISRVEVVLPPNVPITPMVFEFRKK